MKVLSATLAGRQAFVVLYFPFSSYRFVIPCMYFQLKRESPEIIGMVYDIYHIQVLTDVSV